jgi:hypothetical protein
MQIYERYFNLTSFFESFFLFLKTIYKYENYNQKIIKRSVRKDND